MEGDSRIKNAVGGDYSPSSFADVRELVHSEQKIDEELESLRQRRHRLQPEQKKEALKAAKQRKKTLTGLSESISELTETLDNELLTKSRQLAEELATQRLAASNLRGSISVQAVLEATEEELWRDFIKSAHALVESRVRDKSYPNQEDKCLLCGQHLTENARETISRLFKYATARVEKEIKQLELKRRKLQKRLEKLEFNFLSADRAAHTVLSAEQPALLKELRTQLKTLAGVRDTIVTALNEEELESLPTDVPAIGALEELNVLLAKTDQEIKQREEEDVSTKLETINERIRFLTHAKYCQDHWPSFKEFSERLEWRERADDVVPNSRTVSRKQSQLFDAHVTAEYRQRFEDYCRQLKCNFGVSITTRGSKGETLKGLEIGDGVSPGKILSDGEQRAVAMADFLTDVEFRERCSAVIFDDPVTSLDHRWKQRFAQLLVETALQRQVIVFTHDLAFVYQLAKEAHAYSDLDSRYPVLYKAEKLAGLVEPGENPGGIKITEQMEAIRKILANAKKADHGERLSLLKSGFGLLRSLYEKFSERCILKGVVRRFNNHVRVGNLRQVHLDEDFVRRFLRAYDRVHDRIEGHSQSLESGFSEMDCDDLQFAFEAFEKLRDEYNAQG